MKEITVKNRNCGSYGYFWRNDPDLKKVTILNPEDFKKPDFISDSDLAQGGLCDHKEIIHRNKMMTFLFDNPKLREKISKWSDINRSISSLPKSENNDEIPLHFSKYSAWNHNKKKPIVRAIEKAKIDFNKTIGLQKAQEVIDFINKYSKLQFGVNYGIDSPATNRDFRWNFLSNIYSSDENVEIYIKLRNERAWFFSRLEEILELCNKISNFQSVALRNNLPLCMPKIKNSGTGVTFLALAPIDMMNQGKKMIPFSFPSINGRMICLTGRHGRGKSVAGNSILQSLWLAQSGLPVFAESFEFDIKDVIGAIVNDEGEGSTATIFLQKAKNLLKNIQKVPVEKSLIFIDEIGKGTQEDAGMKLGVRLLKTISKNGYSAVFNTQIMDLANFAKNDLDAICLKVENNHQFSPGIGEGGMEDLIKEIGLDKYLSYNNQKNKAAYN